MFAASQPHVKVVLIRDYVMIGKHHAVGRNDNAAAATDKYECRLHALAQRRDVDRRWGIVGSADLRLNGPIQKNDDAQNQNRPTIFAHFRSPSVTVTVFSSEATKVPSNFSPGFSFFINSCKSAWLP